MNSQGPTKPCASWGLACLMLVAVLPAFGQQFNDPQQLQKDGIAKIDHWLNYVRRTGDAKSTVSELSIAEAELKISLDLFTQRQDYAGASFSAIKIANIRRLLDQFRQAATIYQGAIELARSVNRTDYQTTGLANLAYTELQLGDTDSAEQFAREAVRLGANCGNKSFYFEALDTAAEIEVKRGNLAAAGDYLDRALAMSGQIDDKNKLYMGYMDRADIYEQVARKCDYQRNFDVCYQSLELARADYQKGLAITQELGYTYFSQLFQGFLKNLDTRKAMIQSQQRGDQTVTSTKLFSPQKPKDVLVTEHFTSGAMDPATLAVVEGAVKQLRAWQARMQQQGLVVQDLNPSDLCLEGQYEEMKGNNDAALKAYLQADDLLEKDRRKLGDEQARGAFMEDKLSCYYRPALILLDARRYPEAFTIFERSRSRAMADLLASRPLTLGSDQERALYSQLQTSEDQHRRAAGEAFQPDRQPESRPEREADRGAPGQDRRSAAAVRTARRPHRQGSAQAEPAHCRPASHPGQRAARRRRGQLRRPLLRRHGTRPYPLAHLPGTRSKSRTSFCPTSRSSRRRRPCVTAWWPAATLPTPASMKTLRGSCFSISSSRCWLPSGAATCCWYRMKS